MEKFKDPAMMLATVDTVGLIGLGYYVMEQLKSIRADQAKLADSMKVIARRVTEFEKNEQNRLEVFTQINNDVKVTKERIETQMSSIEELDQDVTELFQSLDEDHNMSIDRPSQRQLYRPVDRRNGSRRPDHDDKREMSRRAQPRSRDFDSRPSARSAPARREPLPSQRNETRASPVLDEEDDATALIAETRRQQPS